MDRTPPRWVLVIVAVLGAAAGQVATSRSPAACDCAPHAWRVVRREVTSSDPGANHGTFWPAAGTLTSYPGEARIWADQMTVGVITRIGNSR